MPATIAQALRTQGLDPVDARLLLQHVAGLSHAALIAHAHRCLDERQRAQFLQLSARRTRGEPVAYLVGWREFYGRRFAVDAAVLIPRPETELLVDLALQRLAVGAEAHVLDLGTGSGNIALTLALERPRCSISAVDASAAALAVARNNACGLQVGNVEFLQGDWFAAVPDQRFDLIVSNPPYVAGADPHLARGDLRFEPPAALRGGADGLDAIRAIVRRAPAHLRAGGWLLLEHGYDQGKACLRLLADAGFDELATARDLSELPRASAGRIPRCVGSTRTGDTTGGGPCLTARGPAE